MPKVIIATAFLCMMLLKRVYALISTIYFLLHESISFFYLTLFFSHNLYG